MNRHLQAPRGATTLRLALGAPLILAAAVAVLAATPPSLVNYQGVLRDATDKPRNGTFDMVFSFFDAASAGNQILVDSHTGGGGNAVTVSNGLFNAQLGGGTVTDGSGAGSYTSVDQVFRDFSAVWLEIKVGAETLSPRIRVQASAYALNASNLQGKDASSFVDTTATGQTKAGHLIVNGGIDTSVASGIAFTANGTQTGGAFGANGAFAYVADNGFIKTGIRAQGDDAGGFFKDNTDTSVTYVAHANDGIDATGSYVGGTFSDNAGNVAYAGYSLGYGLYASGNLYGVYGYGGSSGGYFSSGSGSGYAYAGSGDNGIVAAGAPAGHFASSSSAVGTIDLASGDFGALGHGRYPGAGGYFDDPYNSGKAWIGFGDEGIYGIGSYAGGYFTRSYHNVQAFLGSSNYDGYPSAVYGYQQEGSAYAGYFRDDWYGSWTAVAAASAKVYGTGSVNFVQNHPTDPTKTIVYASPEGDEVAVYTRGSARLVDGEARVKLGETFKWVTNPDLGLTAHLTPRDEPVALAVVSVSTGELVVRGPVGSNAAFDYLVYGLRIGFEARAVVQTKRDEAFIPSHRVEEDEYAKAPELRSYSALARYTRMRQELTGDATAPDLSAAKALETAIHVFDPATDAHGPHKGGPEPGAGRPPVPSSIASASRAERDGERAMTRTPSAAPIQPEPPAQSENQLARSLPNTTLVAIAEPVEAGDVVANDGVRPGELRRAAVAADPGVIGIVAGTPGSEWTAEAPVALAGTIVPCKVDASYAAIAANDLLVASATPGYAMRAGESPKQGTVVGKALEPLTGGTGVIRVLVMSR